MSIPLDAMGDLPEPQKAQLLKSIEQMQLRDSLRMYNSVVERCFKDCVSQFRGTSLDSTEDTCVRSCANKFTKASSRIGTKFQELTSEMEQQMMQQMQQQQQQQQLQKK
eukprot:TRINITY_DN1675_c1_g1_i13.p2 TRINITY_DN1675_c1_g1~~TRINITY_DN1675_c1_g1_i13.p2  ORF type:complete len:109 (+),score=18.04 TRINITY_DN1675_c1_g1_i13:66-392(+)